MAMDKTVPTPEEQTKTTPQSPNRAQPLEEVIAKQLAPLQDTIKNQQSVIDKLNSELEEQRRKPVMEEKDKSVKDLMSLYEDDYDVDDKYDRLNNRQMIDVITKSVDKAISNQKSSAMYMIDDALKQEKDKTQRLEKAVMQIVANLSINEAKRKYDDFDNYKQEIGENMGRYPGMDFENAYILAKSRRSSEVPPKISMDTEKPDSFANAPGSLDDFEKIASRGRRAPSVATDESDSRSGVAGFRSFVDDAIDSILKD